MKRYFISFSKNGNRRTGRFNTTNIEYVKHLLEKAGYTVHMTLCEGAPC
jgi:hypothetical protein